MVLSTVVISSNYYLIIIVLQCFHEIAYSAESSVELLDGLDQFLEDSIVLPPGDWDRDLLLPLMHKRHELRRRKGMEL